MEVIGISNIEPKMSMSSPLNEGALTLNDPDEDYIPVDPKIFGGITRFKEGFEDKFGKNEEFEEKNYVVPEEKDVEEYFEFLYIKHLILYLFSIENCTNKEACDKRKMKQYEIDHYGSMPGQFVLLFKHILRNQYKRMSLHERLVRIFLTKIKTIVAQIERGKLYRSVIFINQKCILKKGSNENDCKGNDPKN